MEQQQQEQEVPQYIRTGVQNMGDQMILAMECGMAASLSKKREKVFSRIHATLMANPGTGRIVELQRQLERHMREMKDRTRLDENEWKREFARFERMFFDDADVTITFCMSAVRQFDRHHTLGDSQKPKTDQPNNPETPDAHPAP